MSISLADWLKAQGGSQDSLRRGVMAIAQACGEISEAVARAPLAGQLGALESTNVQDETQKALDVIANEIFLSTCAAERAFAGFASEEMEDVVQGAEGGELLLAFDPLDGSSNIEVSMCVGSIFSILPATSGRAGPISEADFLQPGRAQLAAGYALYGPQSLLVLSVGGDVVGFTLDRKTDAWVLTHPQLRVAEDSSEYAINASNARHWPPRLQELIEAFNAGKEGRFGRDFNMRWTAAMVADVHRVLIRGGLFLYPADARPKVALGKLRLLYECSPMAWLVEQAGGAAMGAEGAVLDIEPTSLHQRSPIMLGSKLLTERAWRHLVDRQPSSI